ncbi:universal stress protein [Streptomyces sp. NPDC059398]|uniref:universal stress protein n=1 Tax=Streptomyces sp. NPDC059398 TaxID=3346820 RepID=UPI0036CA2839
MKPVVTVGLDGTPESLSAALWAAQEAAARGATLRLLHAWVLLAAETAGQRPEEDRNYWAKRIVSDAADTIEERFPDLPVYEDLVAKAPVDALLEAAGESRTLVLGSRALTSLSGYFLGDIGMHVLARATVPTVLVRAREDEAPIAEDGDVVLGLSLRRPCDELVEYAFAAAARRDATLRVVHGRSLPPSAYNRAGPDPFLTHELTREAERDLTGALSPLRDRFPDVPVVERVRTESPARAVVSDVAATGLLVVGRREKHRPFAPRLSHVVSSAVHHAPCPVAVVPHG